MTPLRFYLAASSHAREDVHMWIKRIESATKWRCSYDWTQGDGSMSKYDAAHADINGVHMADLLILWLPAHHKISPGALFEAGIAHTLRKPIVLVTDRPDTDGCLFFPRAVARRPFLPTIAEAVDTIASEDL